MVFVMPFNAIMDALENLVSFLMLTNPTGFADWLIYPYSSFAVAKFALYGVGYLWIVIALCIALVNKLYRLLLLFKNNSTGASRSTHRQV